MNVNLVIFDIPADWDVSKIAEILKQSQVMYSCDQLKFQQTAETRFIVLNFIGSCQVELESLRLFLPEPAKVAIQHPNLNLDFCVSVFNIPSYFTNDDVGQQFQKSLFSSVFSTYQCTSAVVAFSQRKDVVDALALDGQYVQGMQIIVKPIEKYEVIVNGFANVS